MNDLVLLAYRYAPHYGHSYGGGMTDWLTHMVVSSVVYALIYSFSFRLMHHLTLIQAGVLAGSMLLVLFIWRRSRDRRGW